MFSIVGMGVVHALAGVVLLVATGPNLVTLSQLGGALIYATLGGLLRAFDAL